MLSNQATKRVLFTLSALACVQVELAWCDIQFYRLGKRIAYAQTSDNQPTTPAGMDGGVDLFATDPGGLISARVFSTKPALLSPASPFSLSQFSPGYWGNSSFYPSLEAMDANLPPGDTFGYLIEGGNLGNRLALLRIPEANLFALQIPYFTGGAFDELNGLNPTVPYTFEWNGFTPLPGINDAPIFFSVYRVSDGQFMAGTTVANTVTSFMLPANTLAPNTQYRADLDYSSRVNTLDAGFIGGDASVTFDLLTTLTFTTGSFAAISIPEPATALLLGAALSAFLLRRKNLESKYPIPLVLVFAACAASPVSAEVQFYRYGKSLAYQQTSDLQPASPLFFFGGMDMFTTEPADFTSARVFSTRTSPPGPAPEFILTEFSPGYWGYRPSFPSLEAMDAEFVIGDTFGFLIEGGLLGSQLALLETPTANLFAPDAPFFTHNAFSALNDLNPELPYTIQWNSFTPLPEVTDAPVFLTVYRVSDGQPMISTVVANTVTSFLIPGGTLESNTEYLASLVFSSRVNVVDAGFFGADSSIGFDQSVELRFTTGSQLPGDFDFDGDVDGRDFLVWQRGGSPTVHGAIDLMNWQANYGAGSVVAATVAVPEPLTSLTLLSTLCCCVFMRVRSQSLTLTRDFSNVLVRGRSGTGSS